MQAVLVCWRLAGLELIAPWATLICLPAPFGIFIAELILVEGENSGGKPTRGQRIKHAFRFQLEIYMLILERHTCCHLEVELRLAVQK